MELKIKEKIGRVHSMECNDTTSKKEKLAWSTYRDRRFRLTET